MTYRAQVFPDSINDRTYDFDGVSVETLKQGWQFLLWRNDAKSPYTGGIVGDGYATRQEAIDAAVQAARIEQGTA